MNEQERSELERLKQRQVRLEHELALFATQLNTLERRICAQGDAEVRRDVEGGQRVSLAQAQRPDAAPVSAPPVISPLPFAVPKVEAAPVSMKTAETPRPIGPESVRLRLRAEVGEKNFAKGLCRACGGHLEFPLSAAGDTILCPHCGGSTLLSVAVAPVPVPPPVPRALTAAAVPAGGSRPAPPPVVLRPAPAVKESFEMRLGTYWLVRIGIVMVLTSLVFFGNLAYHNFISKLGPGGKVALLYLASGGLLAAGGWWLRRAAKETLKNYAQVLFAGGLAAVYFTTYAAHYNDHLKVIQNQALAGALLLGWAGFMVWIADRKKSEVLALFAVGLAYYTSIITRVGYFTLYSNLVLTAAAVFFLVRNRWAALSFASLIATYAAYAFWRFFDGSAWHWASPAEGLWTGTCFLISYWLLFTAAVFLSKDEKFAGQNRASFITLNNGAFFAGFLLTMMQVHTGGFWKFCLIYGSVLLVLAEGARRFLAAEPLAKNSYLTQGLLLVTVGFITKYSGLQLALILATESVVLLITGQQRKNRVLLAGAYLSAGLAVGWGMDGMREFDQPGLWLGLGLAGLMLVNTVLAHRETATASQAVMRPQPSFFAVLALLVGVVIIHNNTVPANFPLVLALAAVPLTLSIYVLRVRELTLFSQGYRVLAQVAWVVNVFDTSPAPAWWKPVLMIAVSLGLSHWWQKQKVIELHSQIGLFWQGLYALAIIGVLYGWLGQKCDLPAWLAVTSLLAVVITAYGVATRAWLLAICGQLFLAVSCVQFALQLAQGKPHWLLLAARKANWWE